MNKVLGTRGFALVISLMGLTIAAVLSGCGHTGATAQPTPAPTETFTVACPAYAVALVKDAALSCKGMENGVAVTHAVDYAVNVPNTVASISDTGAITTGALNKSPIKVTVTATDSTTKETATTTFYVVNWLVGSILVGAKESIIVTPVDGSSQKTLMTSTCLMPKVLHSRLGFTCVDYNSVVKVFMITVAEDGTASGVTLAMTMPLKIGAISAVAASPDGTTFAVEGEEFKTDGTHFGVYTGTLADGTTQTKLIQPDYVCSSTICPNPTGPNWSEDQSTIVYNHVSGGGQFVNTMPATGGNGTSPVDNPPNEAGWGIFSTDVASSNIYYTELSADGDGQGTYVVPSNGGTATLKISNATATVQGPGGGPLATGTQNGIDFNDPVTGKPLGSITTLGSASLSW